MDRSARYLVYGLLSVIILVGVGSSTFVLGLSLGRAESTTLTAPQVSLDLPAGSSTPASLDFEQNLQLLEEAYNLIKAQYYGEVPEDAQLAYGAIRGMLQRLGDDYTSFLDPAIVKIEEEDASGAFEGIGAFVRINNSQRVELVRIIKGSPAEQVGLRAGDQIAAVDGESIIGFGIYEAIALIRGPAGSQVRLTIQRPDAEAPFEITVTRARIETPLVEARMIGSDVAYVSLTDFQVVTAAERLNTEIEALLARNPKGLILDLRGNPGGFLDEAIDVADLFLNEGLVMIERQRDGGEETFRSDSGDAGEETPLVVLVDGGSASASEIVAGAVQDRDRGVLIGTLTFGKGSVQRVNTLSDGSQLRVTIARWFTPNNRAIHGEGLEPDIVVAPGENASQDPQLDRAVEYLRTGK
ncbi:MAG TPA: S41 family peptidase [Anaerolineae bacterium]|nr:S41 family peptidase [Anaerolineae bacterium]